MTAENVQGYEGRHRELKDYVWDFGYHLLAHNIGSRFRAKNLLILTGNEKVDVDGALRIKDDLYDFATTAWVEPVLEDTSLEKIEPLLKDVDNIILFKERGYKTTMKPLISLGRKIRRKYGIRYYPAAFADLDEITRPPFHFASKKDEEIPEYYVTPIRKIYEFTHDYDDPLVILSVGEESETWAAHGSYLFIKRLMQKEHFNYFTLKFGDGIEGIRKEDLKNRRVIAFEKDCNETHFNRLKRELIEDGYSMDGLMYFSLSPEPYAEIFLKTRIYPYK